MQGSQSDSSLPSPVGGQPLTDTVLGDVTEQRELRQLRQQADALAQVVASVTASPASLEQRRDGAALHARAGRTSWRFLYPPIGRGARKTHPRPDLRAYSPAFCPSGQR